MTVSKRKAARQRGSAEARSGPDEGAGAGGAAAGSGSGDDRADRGGPGERSEGRGLPGRYYPALITRVGKLELRVPRDRNGQFSTELFERISAARRRSWRRWRRCTSRASRRAR